MRTTTLNQNGEVVQVTIGTVVLPRRATQETLVNSTGLRVSERHLAESWFRGTPNPVTEW